MFEPFDSTYDADLEVALDLAVTLLADTDDTDTVVVDVDAIATNAAARAVSAAAPLALVRPVVTPEDVARAAARRAAATVALAPEALDDEWFGSFDETKPVDSDDFEDQPTTTWRRLSDWLWRRAA